MAGEKKKKRIFDFSLLRRVFQYAAPYKGRLYWSVFLAVLLAALSPLRPWLIQLTINDFIRKGSAPVLSIKEKMEVAIIWLTIWQIGLLLLETVARFYFLLYYGLAGPDGGAGPACRRLQEGTGAKSFPVRQNPDRDADHPNDQ